jgi:hypothetical protein
MKKKISTELMIFLFWAFIIGLLIAAKVLFF